MQKVDERLQLVSTIAKIYRGLIREFNNRLGKVMDLSYLDFSILKATSEEPRSMVYLANRYFVTQSAITAATDKLEAKGLVRRVRDNRDRRVVLVEITPKGMEVLENANELLRNLVNEVLSDVNNVSELLEGLNKILIKVERSNG
ncbi:putative transcriptional regulator [Saccharolobus shibatae B12]|uniref:Transcriptional regulator n=2 Tax=Saccharolobus shibatae TaxID=2286 RepID=A0A8F5BNW6_SACSH|nr:MarR family winged helix-turn-helix transcriptional regulator [Saccharolobus shibatae]QXJ28616.1 putative transcriptional regulator [Saccharolobus shibatae B12]QXJ34985.1 putative transcriptional regulator [Saccharolobus shibatae]